MDVAAVDELMRAGRIRGQRSGAFWVFQAADEPGTSLVMGLARVNDGSPATRFEHWPDAFFAVHYAIALAAGSVPGVPKHFNFVSPDMHSVEESVIGKPTHCRAHKQ